MARVSTNISNIIKCKSIAQKIIKNSLKIQQPLCHMYALHGEDEDRKAYACYHQKFRDVSYIATFMWLHVARPERCYPSTRKFAQKVAIFFLEVSD